MVPHGEPLFSSSPATSSEAGAVSNMIVRLEFSALRYSRRMAALSRVQVISTSIVVLLRSTEHTVIRTPERLPARQVHSELLWLCISNCRVRSNYQGSRSNDEPAGFPSSKDGMVSTPDTWSSRANSLLTRCTSYSVSLLLIQVRLFLRTRGWLAPLLGH